MSKVPLLALLATGLVVAAGVAGCSQKPAGDQPAAQPPTSSQTSQNEPMTMGHEGHEGGDQMGQMGGTQMGSMTHEESGQSKFADALAKLSPGDRELAEKQKVCPVSGEPLGAMGTPYKVTVKDREVFLCCPGCESKIKENPDEYLAKLDQ